MKKILIFLLLFGCIAAAAAPQKKRNKKVKQKEKITAVEFETFARRGHTQVVITKDSAISIGRTDKKFVLISAEQWKEIQEALQNIPFASIPMWKSPTKAREYDGAAHCRITIVTSRKNYESQYFDSGQPVKQLKLLYDVIEKVRAVIDADGKVYPATE